MRNMLPLALPLLVVAATYSAGRAEERPLKVFVLAGTSNMHGSPARISDLPENIRQPLKEVLVYQDGNWVPVEPGKNVVGNEATFGLAMASHLGEPIGIHRITVASAANRSPGVALSSFAKQAGDKGRPIVLAGMLLDVSFRDGNNEGNARAYAENLTHWVEVTRREIGNAQFPIVMNRAIPPVARTPHLEEIRKAQVALKLPHFRVFDCDDVTRGPDNVHFNTAGRLEMGRRFAAEMIELIKGDR
jgi:hypothetical protein